MHVLQIGCGALGTLLAEATLAAGHSLTVVRRSRTAAPAGATLIQADVVHDDPLLSLQSLHADVLIYCLAPSDGTPLSYQQTYVHGLRQVLNCLPVTQFKHVFFVSSTRVFGESAGEWVDDDSPALPSDACGHALREAEQLLETLPCGHTALRIAGIYGPQRLHLLRLAHAPERWPQQSVWSNRMHEQDVVGAILHLYHLLAQSQPLPPHMILSDGVPSMQHEVLQWLATQMGLPAATTAVTAAVSGKRLRNLRLQQSGYPLKFSDYRAGYRCILHSQQAQP